MERFRSALCPALSGLSLLLWVIEGARWFRGIRRIPVLDGLGDQEPDGGFPFVSVIAPARDEERGVREGVGSLLGQDYPEYEVIAVDDRSTDRTPGLLDELAAEHPELKVVHLDDLPPGWLGKTHALHAGAEEARGEWLLFTDADVRLSPWCLRRAVGYAVSEEVSYLTLMPEMVSRSVLLRSLVAVFILAFMIYMKPWRAPEPGRRDFFGVGAFSLIRRDAYREVGGHRTIALRPDDDIKLAKLVKERGFAQGVAFGTGLASVEWYRSVREAVRGLNKSIFPGIGYRAWLLALLALLFFLTNALPFLGLFARGPARVLAAANAVLLVAVYWYQWRRSGMGPPAWYAALHPVGSCIFTYTMLRSMITALASGGVEWRGTSYPLEALRENRV